MARGHGSDVGGRAVENQQGQIRIPNNSRICGAYKVHLPLVKWLWIDTCYIKQHSDRELAEAINPTFRWYRDAEVCFAYLKEVTTTKVTAQFGGSVWFMRGWTLEALLALSVVVFLSKECEVIGHKGHSGHGRSGMSMHTGPSLEVRVATITKIPKVIL